MVVRKVVHIIQDLTGANTFSKNINQVNFNPDEMIVRQITYKRDLTETDSYVIYSNIVNDFIGSFFDGCSVNPETTFPINKALTGSYQFQVQDSTGASPGISGVLILTLEFIKYK